MADTLKRYLAVINASSGETTVSPPVSTTTTKTVLSISMCNSSTTDITFRLYLYDSSIYVEFLRLQSLPAKSTFIFNSKLIMESGEYLSFWHSAQVDSLHVVTSYLDQT